MHKPWLISIFCIACVGLAGTANAICLTAGFGIPCCAQANMSGGGVCSGPAQTYKFTIESFSFVRGDGSLITLGSPTQFDAASAGAGNAMGNFIAGATLPVGTYVAVEPKVNLTETVSANNVTSLDGLTCNGSVTSTIRTTGIPNCAAGQPDSSVKQCLNGSDMLVWDNSLGNITVTPTTALKIAFTFLTESGVLCTYPGGGGNATGISIGPLEVTMSLL